MYAAALAKGIRLVNTPTQHHRAIEGDRALRLLRGITPETMVVRSVAQCEAAARRLGFPLFVKGAVKSRKEAGWSACVASNLEELRSVVEATLVNTPMTRGRVLVRRLALVRRLEGTIGDFPISREYRVFVYREQVLALGFYWEDYADLERFSASDEQAVRALAREAAHRLNVPFLIVDVGELDSGEWTVIEAGDAQFAGLSKVSPLALWSQLIERIG